MMYNNDPYSEEKSTIIIETEDSNKIKIDVVRNILSAVGKHPVNRMN